MKLTTDRLKELRAKPSGANGSGTPPRTGRIGARLGYRARTLGLAAVLALTALVLTLSYVRSYKSSVDAGTRTGVALVAGRDLEPGTPASALGGRGVLVRREVTRVPGAVAGPRELAGLVVAEPIYAGEQVSIRRFRPAGEEGVRGELSGTARAVVVSGDRTQLLGGLLRSGDRVDVLGAVKRARPGGGEEVVTRVVLRDLLVLVAGEDAAAIGADGSGGSLSIVLQLTDRQAQKLFYVQKNGQWALQLRPYGRAAESPAAVDNAESVLGIPRQESP